MGDLVSLQDGKRATLVEGNRVTVAKCLFDLSQQIARGDLEHQPYAVVVALVSPAKVEITWTGIQTHDELTAVRMQLNETIHANRARHEPRDMVQWSREQETRQRAEQDAYLAAHPWVCEAAPTCRKRFKSERGARIHERTCHWLRQSHTG